ncbi:MAG: substrate-binding domain-containing protein [Firmicutes bacterium]|nr:substrate-binding domain-containing protein [Bacillota bacterium]
MRSGIKRILLFVFILLFSALLGGCGEEKKQKTAAATGFYDFEPITEIKDGQKNIYVVLKVIKSQYWQDVVQGIADAGNEAGCNVYMGGPEGEGDWQVQKTMLEKAVNELGADAVILAPASSSYLSDTLADIYAKGLPVVLVDTIVNIRDYDICYMTDNLNAGSLAAEEMLKKFRDLGISENEQANIAIQIPSTSSQTIIDRLAGFNQYWSTNAPENWHVLDEVKINNGNTEKAKQNCMDYIDKYPDIRGFFGCNNSSSVGFVNGLNEKGRQDIALVAFDYADETAAYVAENENAATIVQNQYNMGFEGLKTALDILGGKPVEYKFADTGIVIIEKDNQKDRETGK